MHNHSRRLIDHQNVGVLVQNIERYRFRGQRHGLWRRNAHYHSIAAPHLVRRTGYSSIHRHLPRVDQPLHRRARQVRERLGDKTVDAPAVCFDEQRERLAVANFDSHSVTTCPFTATTLPPLMTIATGFAPKR